MRRNILQQPQQHCPRRFPLFSIVPRPGRRLAPGFAGFIVLLRAGNDGCDLLIGAATPASAGPRCTCRGQSVVCVGPGRHAGNRAGFVVVPAGTSARRRTVPGTWGRLIGVSSGAGHCEGGLSAQRLYHGHVSR